MKKSLLWDVTSICNLNCRHCYNSEQYKDKRNMFCQYETKFSYQNIIDIIQQFGIDHIHLLGGEPLLNPDVFDIIKYATTHNIIVSINTNGTLLNSSIIDKLIDSGIAQITISLDGATRAENDSIRGTGTFDLVLNNIRMLTKRIEQRRSNIIVQLACVITKVNINNLHLFPELAYNNGIPVINLMTLYKCGEAYHNYHLLEVDAHQIIEMLEKILLQAVKLKIFLQIDCKPRVLRYFATKYNIPVQMIKTNMKCYGGDNILYMDAFGYLYPCNHAKNIWDRIDFNQRIHISYIKDENSLFEKKLWQKFYHDKHLSSFLLNATCTECDVNYACFTCPLDKNHILDPLCLQIQYLEKQLYNSLLHRKPKIDDKTRILHYGDEYVVVNLLARDIYKIDNKIYTLLNKIDGHKTIEQLFKEINLKSRESWYYLDALLTMYYKKMLLFENI